MMPLLGLPTKEITKKLLPQFTDQQITPIYEYSRLMSQKYIPLITLMPRTITILKKLNKKYTLALITNRSKPTTQLLLRRHNLKKYFAVIIDREDVTRHKPHPEGINKALKKLRLKPSDTIFVGDMPEDILAAHNAKLKSILISKKRNRFATDFKLNELKKIIDLLKKIDSP